MNLSSIFLGSIASEQRKFLKVFLEYMRKQHFVDKIIIPCVGQFGAVKCALEAGFTIDQIECSDISLFSSLLGYYYGEKDISELGMQIVQTHHKAAYDKLDNDQDRVAFLMVLMKIAQLRKEVHYEATFITEIECNFEKYRLQIKDKLIEGMKLYRGLKYEIKDLRWYFINNENQYKKTELVIMNPPIFAKGYTKMFNFHEFIKYEVNVPEFNFQKEYENCYVLGRNMKAHFLWHTHKKIEGYQKDIIFTKQESIDKYCYWLYGRTNDLDGFEDRPIVFKSKDTGPNKEIYKMLPSDHELTIEDTVTLTEISKEAALYYRDLFAHRLGSTVAETYIGLFCNGMLWGVAGFNTSFLRRLQETYIFENFCFCVAHDKYENLNRLAMLLLVSGEFKKYLVNVTLKSSAYVELKSLRTTCLTKYRKAKLNNGLLKASNIERQPNGTYKLTYDADFYMDRDYKKCMDIYLSKDVRLKKQGVTETEEEVETEE